AHESCGKCAPCAQGSHTVVLILKKLLAGNGTLKDLETLERIVGTINVVGSTLCPTGQAYAAPVKAMVEKFRGEFEALIK
ncbi:MAG: NADH-quinone oxidoreductase subunit F, partial [Deltaproteobacteria bacterium]|nr:NADH-quinone oxidoreductase subunit F [Deltaproteobacteria bacterium]